MEQPSASSLEPAPFSRDFTHLLTSNDVPLDSEIPFIRDIISNGENSLDALDFQIESLQSTLARLASRDAHIHSALAGLQDMLVQFTRKRDEMAESVRRHRALLHPIRCLPQELICDIFSWVLLGEENPTNRPRAPWHLALISQSWRRAALSYTPLWCFITLSPSAMMASGASPRSEADKQRAMIEAQLLRSARGNVLDIGEADKRRAMTEAQLLRSANALLNIAWEAGKYVESRLLDLVVAHCGRWRTLRLTSGQEQYSSASGLDWLRPTAGRLAQLEKLEVALIPTFSNGQFPVPDVFIAALALRHVALTDRNFRADSPSDINIPWAQITHYRGNHLLSCQLEILAETPALIECAIQTRHQYMPDNQDMVLLPRLRRLHVEEPKILNHLETPLLDTLSSSLTTTLDTLLPFIQRSSCTLTKLVLVHCRLSESSPLIALFEGLPALTYLLLGAHFSPQKQSTLLDALTLAGTSSDLCPNLTSLLYGCPSFGDEEDRLFPRDLFFAMVQSRCEIISPEVQSLCRPSRLDFLRIFRTSKIIFPPPKDVLVRLEALRDMGLDAVFLKDPNSKDLQTHRDFI
ncbi:hypothetical protein K438DRAFT_357168 [Mycena galopus ATCC 62051]|nr:hypothetical protein K438DRAFT_357168 [Mycena galopus ATCC 62051]